MLYYVIEITNETEKAIYSYETLDLAVATFHSKLGGAMKSDNCYSEMVMVINEVGAVIKSEYYKRSLDDGRIS